MSPEYTKNRISRVLVLKGWLDSLVSGVFSDYCEIFDIHRAYGVQSYHIEYDSLDIIQDISCRGCYDTQSHSLPIEYLYLDGDDRRELMRLHKKEKDDKNAHQKKNSKKYELERALAEVDRLSKELAGK
jgi:hypothetical protein